MRGEGGHGGCVPQRGGHALNVGDEDDVGSAGIVAAENPRPRLAAELLLKDGHGLREALLAHALLGGRRRRVAEPLAPRAEERPLELALRGDGGKRRAQRPEGLLERGEDDVALGDDAIIELKGRQHSGRHDSLVPRLFLAIAEHRDLCDAVRDLLLL